MDETEIAKANELIRLWRSYALALNGIVGELGVGMDGKFPNETRRAIHEHLRKLAASLEGCPTYDDRLHILDRLVAMFPPPDD